MTTYTVKSGDTLSAIASRNGVTVAALAAANKISNANLIRVGQTLTIPAKGATITPVAVVPVINTQPTAINTAALTLPAAGSGTSWTEILKTLGTTAIAYKDADAQRKLQVQAALAQMAQSPVTADQVASVDPATGGSGISDTTKWLLAAAFVAGVAFLASPSD